jgi:hypothetical protein
VPQFPHEEEEDDDEGQPQDEDEDDGQPHDDDDDDEQLGGPQQPLRRWPHQPLPSATAIRTITTRMIRMAAAINQ